MQMLGLSEGKKSRRAYAALVVPVRSEEGLSHWGLVKHIAKRPGNPKQYKLDRPYIWPWYITCVYRR